MNTGNSALCPRENPKPSGKVGGNSGAVISPAPGLGLSAYQSTNKRHPKTGRYGPAYGETTS